MSRPGYESEPFEDVGHQLPRKFARQALNGSRIFLDERGQVRRGLVLLAEDVVLVLVENFAVVRRERDGGNDGDDEA